MTNAPIDVHCTRSQMNGLYSLTTGQSDSVPTIRTLGHSICRMIPTVHAQITSLLAKYKRVVGTQQLVSRHSFDLCYIHRESVRNGKAACLYKRTVPNDSANIHKRQILRFINHHRLAPEVRRLSRLYSSDRHELFAARIMQNT
jgi:hypothetical protein